MLCNKIRVNSYSLVRVICTSWVRAIRLPKEDIPLLYKVLNKIKGDL